MQDFDQLDRALGLPTGSNASHAASGKAAKSPAATAQPLPPADADPFAEIADHLGATLVEATGRRPDGKSKNGTLSTKPTGEKPTNEELDRRIDLVVQFLGQKVPKSLIKEQMNKRYGVGPRTVEAYLSRARDRIIAATQKSRAEHVAESLATYSGIFGLPDATPGDKIAAQREIDSLLGLKSAAKIEISNDTPPTVLEIVVEDRTEMKQFYSLQEVMRTQQVRAALAAGKAPVEAEIAPDEPIDVTCEAPGYDDVHAAEDADATEPPPDDAPILGTDGIEIQPEE